MKDCDEMKLHRIHIETNKISSWQGTENYEDWYKNKEVPSNKKVLYSNKVKATCFELLNKTFCFQFCNNQENKIKPNYKKLFIWKLSIYY